MNVMTIEQIGEAIGLTAEEIETYNKGGTTLHPPSKKEDLNFMTST